MYQSVDRASINDSIFHLVALETINYILQKPIIDKKEKQAEIQELGAHLGERISNHLMNTPSSTSTGGSSSSISSTKMEVDDIMKFLGRDVWMFVFNKQISKLQTNRKGTFLIDIDEIKFHCCLLSEKSSNSNEDKLELILDFVCGIIKGVLGAFNVDCSVMPAFKPQVLISSYLSTQESSMMKSQGQAVPVSFPYSFTINLLNSSN